MPKTNVILFRYNYSVVSAAGIVCARRPWSLPNPRHHGGIRHCLRGWLHYRHHTDGEGRSSPLQSRECLALASSLTKTSPTPLKKNEILASTRTPHPRGREREEPT